jgi:hypothetical protein
VLIAGKGGLYNRIMKLVRHSHDDDVAFGHLLDDFSEQIGKVLLRVGVHGWIRREAVAGKSTLERLVLRQHLERDAIQRTDANLADEAKALRLIDRRQNLHLGYHPAADNANLRFFIHRALLNPVNAGSL